MVSFRGSVRQQQRFCSSRCYGDSLRVLNPMRTCCYCGRGFLARWPSAKNRFCSRECFGSYHRQPVPYSRLTSPRWKRIAPFMRLRDSNRCTVCKCKHSNGKAFHVDHVIPFRVASALTERPDQCRNLVTLCNRCHSRKGGAEKILFRTHNLRDFFSDLLNLGFPLRRLSRAYRACGVADFMLTENGG
jgi:hypothetical protein